MSEYKHYKLVVIINEDVSDASMLTFHGKNIEYSDKQDIVTKNIICRNNKFN